MKSPSICLLVKESRYCEIAQDFVVRNFPAHGILRELNDVSIRQICERNFDYIISFLYPKLVPELVLKSAHIAAINFHPAPPEYPGTGCYNFALYNDEKAFGTTCHHMLRKADTGKIIAVKRFPLFKTDTVESLRERTMIYTLLNFFEVMYCLLENGQLPTSSEQWKRAPYLRRQLDELLEIDLDMTPEEIDRIIRATACENRPGPYIKLNGKKYTIRSA